MSSSYVPDNDATAGDPWNVAFLSDRDVSGQVPINFVPHPGVFLRAACFGNGTYEDSSFKECFSNLLASEFRRFIVDIYWDTLNRRFRLCPAEVPSQVTNGTADAASMPLMQNAVEQIYFSQHMTSAPMAARQVSISGSTLSTASVQINMTSVTNTTGIRASTTAPIPPVSTLRASSGTTLYQIGPYQCSDSLGLDTLFAVLSDYSRLVNNVITSRLQYIILNLHVASTVQAPNLPRGVLSSSELPNTTELVSTRLSQLSSVIYQPILLRNERENLNSSWLSRRKVENFPLFNYFTTQRLPNGDIATPDGWPCENYVQLEQGWRFLFGYGSVDSQISDYNFEGDESLIFLPGVLQSQRNTTLDETGSVTTGCFYNSSTDQIGQLNNSWAVSAVINVDQSILGFAADNLTLCGISPVLNYTLGNRPASVGYAPYQNFGNQALFSWASGEPKNATMAGETGSRVQWACAILIASDDYRGHWKVTDCQRRYRVACREANRPYTWRLSGDAVRYDAADAVCTGNATFDVPRTGLENLYLYNYIRSVSAQDSDSSLLDGVLINFNSLDVDSCWVTTGANGTCPYRQDRDEIRQRTILVPIIAAFVTLLLTALTILVKCNTNRRKSRVRRRGEGGWEYEGIPS